MLTIDPDKVRFVIEKMRELEEEDLIEAETEGEDEGDELHLSTPETEDFSLDDDEALEEEEAAEGESASTDPYAEELSTFIANLDDDEQVELVALAWLGRGDYTLDTWDEALETAGERHNERTAAYLMGMPLLPDLLSEGLAAHGEGEES